VEIFPSSQNNYNSRIGKSRRVQNYKNALVNISSDTSSQTCPTTPSCSFARLYFSSCWLHRAPTHRGASHACCVPARYGIRRGGWAQGPLGCHQSWSLARPKRHRVWLHPSLTTANVLALAPGHHRASSSPLTIDVRWGDNDARPPPLTCRRNRWATSSRH